MACNECTIKGKLGTLSTPYATKAAQERAAMSARERQHGFNCTEGGRVLTLTQRVSVLATADGVSFTSFAAAGADFVRLRPFGNQQVRLHGIVVSGTGPAASVVLATVGDTENDVDVGFGEIRLSGKEIRPTFQGTLANHLAGGGVFKCSNAACGVDPTNSACLAAFNADDPLDIALVNFPAAALVTVDMTFMLEYVPG